MQAVSDMLQPPSDPRFKSYTICFRSDATGAVFSLAAANTLRGHESMVLRVGRR